MKFNYFPEEHLFTIENHMSVFEERHDEIEEWCSNNIRVVTVDCSLTYVEGGLEVCKTKVFVSGFDDESISEAEVLFKLTFMNRWDS